jgi:hypothetical protein
MRQTICLPLPLVVPLTTGLCRWSSVPAGRWPVPALSPPSLYRCLDPYPAVSLWCVCSFLPRGPRPPLTVHRFGTHRRSPQCHFNGGRIAGLQSFRYGQAPILARPPGCTYRGSLLAPEQPGPLPHALDMWLPIMNCDIATCPNRAIDTVGLSPTGLRPCRPLPDCGLPATAHRRLTTTIPISGLHHAACLLATPGSVRPLTGRHAGSLLTCWLGFNQVGLAP